MCQKVVNTMEKYKKVRGNDSAVIKEGLPEKVTWWHRVKERGGEGEKMNFVLSYCHLLPGWLKQTPNLSPCPSRVYPCPTRVYFQQSLHMQEITSHEPLKPVGIDSEENAAPLEVCDQV